tara:strand:- start:3378 stop:3632 length:255 start_codon:yes stop_codon:yes gene_type:complete
MTYDLAKSLREVFDDTPEIMAWFNEDTYAAAEARAHINGMREMMLEAADRIEELKRHVELRDFFLIENGLWERFAKGVQVKTND